MNFRQTMFVLCRSKLNRNIAYDDGGVLYIKGGTTVTIKGSELSDNIAGHSGTGYGLRFGGVAYVEDTTITIVSSIFTNNEVKVGSGGALFVFDTNVIISSSNFTNNSAHVNGGAVQEYDSIVIITASRFINCTADHGGALYFYTITSLINAAVIKES